MPFTTLVSTNELIEHLHDPNWAIVDCRFSLADPEEGRRNYLRAHIPPAIYAHLDEDLSGPVVAGVTGRHPLPDVVALTDTISRWGIDASVQVVAYDDAGGALAAARLWWLLRWLGHQKVAVLDGGWQDWLNAGLPTRGGAEGRPARRFSPRQRPELLADSQDVLAAVSDERYSLFDSRAADRYRGENETIDPVAGHIPTALSAPYAANLDAAGHFLTPDRLRARFTTLFDGIPARRTIFYCGSGATAAHNILAVAHAGLGEARLYAGSWSEWITDPRRPVER